MTHLSANDTSLHVSSRGAKAARDLLSGKEDEVLEAIAQWIVTGATVDEIR